MNLNSSGFFKYLKGVFLIFLLFICVILQAKEGFHLSYYLDNSSRITVEEAINLSLDKAFTTVENYNLNFGLRPDALWIRFIPERNDSDQILVIENAHLDSVNIFLVSNGKIEKEILLGDLVNFHNRTYDFNYLNFKIPAGTDQVIIRVKTEGAMMVPLRLFTDINFFSHYRLQQAIHFIYFGILFLAFCGAIFLSNNIFKKNFIYFILSLLALFIITCIDFRYFFQYLYPNNPEINQYTPLLYLTYIFIILFTSSFLEISKHSTTLNYLFRGIISLFFISIFFNLFGLYTIYIGLLWILGIVAPFFIIASVAHCYFKLGLRSAKFIFLGWLSTVISIVIYQLTVMGFIDFNIFTANVVQMGAAGEIIFFFFALSRHLSNIENEKKEILKRQNVILEEELRKRMLEINEINDELLTQNEQLTEQQEELLLQRNKLEEQYNIIEAQNNQLKEVKVMLEENVRDKTEDLIKLNHDLEDKNRRLEQFAYVAAHNIRGPVASLSGLMQLFNKNDLSSTENLTIIHLLEDTVQKMDTMLNHLSALLDLTKSEDRLWEEVNLKKVLKEITVLLKAKIVDKKATISDSLPEDKCFMVIPVFIHNIFYNMIDNSLDHIKKGTKPEIQVDLTETSGYFEILFCDNGKGIDLMKNGSKLFLPFQRFDENSEGKGLGLFISKSQIEAMNGKIEVESEIGKGTRVKIVLPKHKKTESQEKKTA